MVAYETQIIRFIKRLVLYVRFCNKIFIPSLSTKVRSVVMSCCVPVKKSTWYGSPSPVTVSRSVCINVKPFVQ